MGELAVALLAILASAKCQNKAGEAEYQRMRASALHVGDARRRHARVAPWDRMKPQGASLSVYCGLPACTPV